MDKYWNDMIYFICDGKPSDMIQIQKFNIIDFFEYIENKSKKNGS